MLELSQNEKRTSPARLSFHFCLKIPKENKKKIKVWEQKVKSADFSPESKSVRIMLDFVWFLILLMKIWWSQMVCYLLVIYY